MDNSLFSDNFITSGMKIFLWNLNSANIGECVSLGILF